MDQEYLSNLSNLQKLVKKIPNTIKGKGNQTTIKMKQDEIIPILSQNHPTISNETSEAPPLSLDVGCSTPLSVSASHFFSVWGFLLFENSYSLIKMPLLKPLILGFKRKISGVVTQELFVLTKLKFQWAHLSIFWDRMAEMKKKISQNLVIWILFPSDEQL